jgi:hypothetical protein
LTDGPGKRRLDGRPANCRLVLLTLMRIWHRGSVWRLWSWRCKIRCISCVCFLCVCMYVFVCALQVCVNVDFCYVSLACAYVCSASVLVSTYTLCTCVCVSVGVVSVFILCKRFSAAAFLLYTMLGECFVEIPCLCVCQSNTCWCIS